MERRVNEFLGTYMERMKEEEDKNNRAQLEGKSKEEIEIEDLKKEANKKVEKGKKQGYKYDYKVNMNTLIGTMRKRFILILINMTINGDDKSKDDYNKMIEEISKNLVPIRPDRKNPRNRYKGYNKYRQNYKRNC